jgi:hypothetical protein
LYNSLENLIVVPLKTLYQLTSDRILTHLSNVLTSHQELKLDQSFNVDVGVIDMPKGGRYNVTNVDRSLLQKKSIVEIKNRDVLCLPRALAVSFVKAHQVPQRE